MKQVVLIGDETCIDYKDTVSARLSRKANLWNPDVPARSIQDLIANLHDWILRRQPDIVHLGAGILDTRTICFGNEDRVMPLSQYRRNVSRAFELIASRTTAAIIWATITPVDLHRFGRDPERPPPFEYDNETIIRYNEASREAAASQGVQVNDLYGAIKAASREQSARPSGIRFAPEGNELLAEKVARAVERHL